MSSDEQQAAEKAAEAKEQLALFREEIAKVLPDDTADDVSLQCFIDARKGDLAKASIQYTNMRKWRMYHDVANYFKNFDPEITTMAAACMVARHEGYSKGGHPVYWMSVGQFSPSLLKYLSMGMTMSAHMHDMETMMQRSTEQTAKFGGSVKKAVNVLDLKGIGLSIRSLFPALSQISKMDEDYYPERLHRSYIINAPALFSGLWSVIKGFLDPVVASKVVILSGKFLPTLLEELDEEVIPKQFGGKGDWELTPIPEKQVVAFFEGLEEKQGMATHSLAKGEDFKVEQDVVVGDEGVMHINWKYRTNFKDLGFSVKFTAEGGKEEDLVAHGKAGVADSLITGSVPVKTSGKVTVSFDNKAAYFSASAVSLLVTTTPTKARHYSFGVEVPPGC